MIKTKQIKFICLILVLLAVFFFFFCGAAGEALPPKGDLNQDGNVRADDARIALRAAARVIETTPTLLLYGDVDSDGKISSSDARRILRAAAKLEKLPGVRESGEKALLTGVKIGLDPGHQARANTAREPVAPGSAETKYKVSGGAEGVSTGIPEYVTNLNIALKLRDKLVLQGATVYMTRETHDVDISNIERAQMMNSYGVDLVLRIHCDSSDSSAANGIRLFVSRSNAIAAKSRAYAEIILPIVSRITGAKGNGITQSDAYTGQNWSEVPCIMAECGFLSNPKEDVLLNDPAYQEKLAEGLLQGIVACFAGSEG